MTETYPYTYPEDTINNIIEQSNHSLVYAEHQAQPSRYRRVLGRVAAVGAMTAAILTGATFNENLTDEAQASAPICYGDYCTGLYADVADCDDDAKTIAEVAIVRPGMGWSLEAKSVSVDVGSTDPNEVARLELRQSEQCGTVWGRLNAKAGTGADFWGIMNVGVQQDGGYTEDRNIDGNLVGAPAAVSFGPMVYGRSRMYRAMVDVKNFGVSTTIGTYWTEGPK